MTTTPSSGARRNVAVIGSGVAGLTAAWVMSKSADVTLFEADRRLGGHADTHVVDTAGGPLPVDTGFIVHNDRTYPTLQRLFRELDVATQESDMSMSIHCDGCGLEYSGGQGVSGLFPSVGTALRPKYLTMLREITRFHRQARELLASPDTDDSVTVDDFVAMGEYSPYFTAHFMTPLVSAVWSCNPVVALAYPARYLFTFLEHHGMLGVTGSPTWRTVTGGSVEYVSRVAAAIARIELGTPVRSVRRNADSVDITTPSGSSERFDAAVVATHPRHALDMLVEPTSAEHTVLGTMAYSANRAQLHTDVSVLPTLRRARASWNYSMPACDAKPDNVLVSYDMTRLQRLPNSGVRYLVTLGGAESVDPASVIDEMDYEHPQYTPESIAAQKRLPELDSDTLAFAGAYHGWGFHEDGALSGLRAAERIGGMWT
ncbi:NAD(P)/FAD-dependent oxidoreductase [Actinomycetes bacterium M1A6_2h]